MVSLVERRRLGEAMSGASGEFDRLVEGLDVSAAPSDINFNDQGLVMGEVGVLMLEGLACALDDMVEKDGWDQAPRLWGVLAGAEAMHRLNKQHGAPEEVLATLDEDARRPFTDPDADPLMVTAFTEIELHDVPEDASAAIDFVWGTDVPADLAAVALSVEAWVSEDLGVRPSLAETRQEVRIVVLVSRSGESVVYVRQRGAEPGAGYFPDDEQGNVVAVMRYMLGLEQQVSISPAEYVAWLVAGSSTLAYRMIEAAPDPIPLDTVPNLWALHARMAGHSVGMLTGVLPGGARNAGREVQKMADRAFRGDGEWPPVPDLSVVAGMTWADVMRYPEFLSMVRGLWPNVVVSKPEWGSPDLWGALLLPALVDKELAERPIPRRVMPVVAQEIELMGLPPVLSVLPEEGRS